MTDLISSEVDAYLKCTKKYKRMLPASSCLLPISVGQGYHEGEKFRATILVVNKHFRDCHVVICDSLQRFTIQFAENLSDSEATRVSLLRGREWLERNRAALDLLSIPHQITKWDDWKSDAAFVRHAQDIERLHAADEMYRQSIIETTTVFARVRQSVTIDKSLAEKYIREECAMMSLWIEQGFEFEVYPTKRRAASDFAYRELIGKFKSDKMTRIPLGFIDKPSYK